MFRGKKHDGFSYTINTLFRKNGYMQLQDPDCLSQRQVALKISSETGIWFCSALHWKTYMTRLLQNLGMKDGFILEKANIEFLNAINEEIPFVIGEASIPQWDLNITDKLCGTDSAFLLCEKRKNSFIISNPLGCISMMCSAEHLATLLKNKDAFVFYITKCIPVSITPIPILIQDAVELVNQSNLISAMKNTTPPNSVRKRAALQYGIIGYLQSRIKLAEFFSLNCSVKRTLQKINISNIETIFPQLLDAESCFVSELHSAMQRCEKYE